MDFCVDLSVSQRNLVYLVWNAMDFSIKKTYTLHLIRLCKDIIRDGAYNPMWVENWDRDDGEMLNPVMRIALEGTVRHDSVEKQLFEQIKYNECIFYDDMIALDDGLQI